MTIPTNLVQKARTEFDLTEPTHQKSLYSLTDKLLTLPDVALVDLKNACRGTDIPIEFRIAAKLVESRCYLDTIARPLKIAIVFAMWGEHNRLNPRSADNPNGEDSLRLKLEQMDWATRNTPINWTLYPVDDGCPHDSGGIASSIAESHPLGNHVNVLYLADALPTESGPLCGLASVEDSRKGGAMIRGCMQAIADGADAIIYTDADNSVHLGQIGLLLRPYLEDDQKVVLGDRKHPDAVLEKIEGRWGIGIKVLRHMQRMAGKAIFARNIRDTQAAFKLYSRDILAQIIAEPSVFDFSFDTDWILAVISMEEDFTRVPFAFIDSAAESASITQGPMSTWEMLLKGLATAVRKRGVDHDQNMVRVLDEEIHSSADLDLLINHLPPELRTACDEQLGDPAVMTPAALQAWIQQRKHEENP